MDFFLPQKHIEVWSYGRNFPIIYIVFCWKHIWLVHMALLPSLWMCCCILLACVHSALSSWGFSWNYTLHGAAYYRTLMLSKTLQNQQHATMPWCSNTILRMLLQQFPTVDIDYQKDNCELQAWPQWSYHRLQFEFWKDGVQLNVECCEEMHCMLRCKTSHCCCTLLLYNR